MKLSQLFFWRSEPPVHANINDIFSRFKLYDKLKPDPNAHTQVLDKLGQYSLRGVAQYGPAHSYYSDPDHKAITQERPPQFLEDRSGEAEEVKLSSSIHYTEESLSLGKRSFGMIINKSSSGLHDLAAAKVFGIYGIYNKDGDYTVKKIQAPSFDEQGSIQGTESITVTPENVELALLYAEECLNQIYQNEIIYPMQCMNAALARRDGMQNTPNTLDL